MNNNKSNAFLSHIDVILFFWLGFSSLHFRFLAEPYLLSVFLERRHLNTDENNS